MTMPIVANPAAGPPRAPGGPDRSEPRGGRPDGAGRRAEGHHGDPHHAIDSDGRRGSAVEARRGDDAVEGTESARPEDFSAMLAALVGDAPAPAPAPAQTAPAATDATVTGAGVAAAGLPGGLPRAIANVTAAVGIAGPAGAAGQSAPVTPGTDEAGGGQPLPAGFASPGTDPATAEAVEAARAAAVLAGAKPAEQSGTPVPVSDPARAAETETPPPVADPAATAGDVDARSSKGEGGDGAQQPAPARGAEGAQPVPAAPATTTAPAPATLDIAGTAGVTATNGPGGVTATAPAQAASAPTGPPAPPATQIAMHVVPLRREADGVHRLTVHMNPEALGPVSLVAEIRDNAIQIQLVGSTDAGRDALRNALGDLRKELEEAGFSNTSLDLRQDSPSGQERAFAQQSRSVRDVADGSNGTPGAPAAPAPDRGAPARPGGSRLDLHV